MATRLLRNTMKLLRPLVMKQQGGGGGLKNAKRHAPFMRDGVQFDVDSLTGKLLVHPDDDLAFLASVIRKHATFIWFTKESLEEFDKTHLKGNSNFVSAQSLGQKKFVYFFEKDPTTLGEDADLKQSYDKMIMVVPESQEVVEKLFHAVSPMLKDNGVIKVFHVEAWNIKELAQNCSLECLVVEKFDKDKYPNFAPRRGGSKEKVDLTACVVYSFRVDKKKEEPLSEMNPKRNQKGGKGNQKGGKGRKKEGLQVLVDSENVNNVVTYMDSPEHKALVCVHPHRQYTPSVVSKRGVVHGGVVRTGASEGLLNEVMVAEIEKIRKDSSPLIAHMVPRGRMYRGYPGRNVGNIGTGMLPVPYDMGGMLPRDAAAAMQQPMPITALDSALANAPPDKQMTMSKEDLLDAEKVKDELVLDGNDIKLVSRPCALIK